MANVCKLNVTVKELTVKKLCGNRVRSPDIKIQDTRMIQTKVRLYVSLFNDTYPFRLSSTE
jgi:hypothetical protein